MSNLGICHIGSQVSERQESFLKHISRAQYMSIFFLELINFQIKRKKYIYIYIKFTSDFIWQYTIFWFKKTKLANFFLSTSSTYRGVLPWAYVLGTAVLDTESH